MKWLLGVEQMQVKNFRDALVAAYLKNPCQVLPNPLWKTLDKVDDFETAYGANVGEVSRLEASHGDSLYIYWRNEGRHSSLLIRRKLESVQVALIHQDFLDSDIVAGFATRQPYFRLLHRHQNLQTAELPDGFRFVPIKTENELALVSSLIAQHYGERETPSVESWRARPVFTPDLWLWVMDTKTDSPVGLGIAELDVNFREASLEWVQILPAYRGKGLGKSVVVELLRRVAFRADFTTIASEMEFSERETPGVFYRKCGFSGEDVWWLLGRSEQG
jgi:GNAT superfamily N-acetyltransferase